jgi:hypothetical protein
VTQEARTSPSDVFINCPFDEHYRPIFEALVFAVFACEFRPHTALELDDASQAGIEKLYALIEAWRYSIHDLSRTELDPRHNLPRFNMPFELGVFLGAKRFGDEVQKQKRCLVLDVERYRYQKFISDLSGMDIREHEAEPLRAIQCVRDWLANVSRRSLPSAKLLQEAYSKFLTKKPAIADGLGFDPTAIPYVDYERMVMAWLLEAPSAEREKRTRKRRSKT